MSVYRLSAAAKHDLADIRNYLWERASRRVAARVLKNIHEALHHIADTPAIGHFFEDLGAEPLRLYRVYQYLVIYRPESRPLLIVRVLHGARDVQSLLAGIA